MIRPKVSVCVCVSIYCSIYSFSKQIFNKLLLLDTDDIIRTICIYTKITFEKVFLTIFIRILTAYFKI